MSEHTYSEEFTEESTRIFGQGLRELLAKLGLHFDEPPMEMTMILLTRGTDGECDPILLSNSGNPIAMLHAIKHGYHSTLKTLFAIQDIQCDDSNEIPMPMPRHRKTPDDYLGRQYL